MKSTTLFSELLFVVIISTVFAAPHHCSSAKDKSQCRDKLKQKLNVTDAEFVDLHITNPEKGLNLKVEDSHEEEDHDHEESHEHSHEDDEEEGTFPIAVPESPKAAKAPAVTAPAKKNHQTPSGFASLPSISAPSSLGPVQVREQFFRGPYVNGKGEAIPFLKRVIEFYYYPVDGSLPVAGEMSVPVSSSVADPDLRLFERIATTSGSTAERNAQAAAHFSRRSAGFA